MAQNTRHYWRNRGDVHTLTPQQIDNAMGDWRFVEIDPGIGKHPTPLVRGYHPDGRKTVLKGATKTHSALDNARNDVLNGRIPCRDWPNCVHIENGREDDTIEACVASTKEVMSS